MGLPSGTLWAAVNLGAKQNTDAGLFYQWGAVTGHVDATEFAFTSANYNSQQLDLITEDLSSEHDAASIYFGDPSIRIPSSNDFHELFNSDLVTINSQTIRGVTGMLVQSLTTGHTLFFPNIMGRYVDSAFEESTYPLFWTRNYASSSSALAGRVSPTSNTAGITRWDGLTIRPIKKL